MVRRHHQHGGPATATITGQQLDDGTVVRGISVAVGDVELLDAGEGRRLAAAILEAANEVERLHH